MPFAIQASNSRHTVSARNRLHGLDTLRGLAAVLVVLLHAGIPYMTNPLPYLVWPARDIHPSLAVDAITWCTECFLMPLFFVLAGFFSKGLLVARGEHEFLLGRTKRLLSTQFAAAVTILPICLLIWILGWIADGLYVPHGFLKTRLPPELRAELYGVAHIWFLQNLYIYCLVLCGVGWLLQRLRGPGVTNTEGTPHAFRMTDRVLLSVWKPLLPAIPCALILYCDPRIVLGFYQTFVPVPSKLLYYAIYFFVGATLYGHREVLQLHARFGKTYLVLAAFLFAATLPMIHDHTTAGLSGIRLAQLAGHLALFAWLATFGLIAIFLRTPWGDNSAMRYLAEASFWVYLIHLPLVVLTQIAIVHMPVPTVLKFLLAGATGLAMALLSYQVFVQRTWLGEFLNGHRRSCKPVVVETDPVSSPFVVPAVVKQSVRTAVPNRLSRG